MRLFSRQIPSSTHTSKSGSFAHISKSNEQESEVEPGALSFGARYYDRTDHQENISPIPNFPYSDNISILPPNHNFPQPKLKIHSPGDRYEQEADRIAQQVVQGSTPVVQRKCAKCGKVDESIQHQSLLSTSNSLQRKCATCSKEEETIQTKKDIEKGISTASGLTDELELKANQNSGHSIDKSTLSFMESRFGTNFSSVRIHEDHNAVVLNRKLQSKAFTTGSNIYFNKGQYLPSTLEGKRLLAHELTHVIQQGSVGPSIQMKCATTEPQETERPFVYKLKNKDIVAKFSDEAGAETFVKRYPDLPLTCYKIGASFDVYIKESEKKKAPAKEGEKSKTPTKEGEKEVTEAEETEKETPAGQKTKGTAQPPAQIVFALTFDDGPHVAELGKGTNQTEKVLDVLKSRGIKAGFFIQTGVSFRGAASVGKALVKRMHKEGHTIAIHTGGKQDHELHTNAQKAGRLESELRDAKKYLKDQTGEDTTFVRPPTGLTNKAVLDTYAKSGLTNLLWDIDGDNGKSLPLPTLQKRLMSEMKNVHARGWTPSTPVSKIVVLYHDIQKNTSDNIDTLIQEVEKNTSTLTGGKSKAKFEKP